jgi:hypothetical protein
MTVGTPITRVGDRRSRRHPARLTRTAQSGLPAGYTGCAIRGSPAREPLNVPPAPAFRTPPSAEPPGRSAAGDTRRTAGSRGSPGPPARANPGSATRRRHRDAPVRTVAGRGVRLSSGGAGNRTRVLRRFTRASPCAVRCASTRIHRSREQAGVTIPVAVSCPARPRDRVGR